MSIAVPQGMPPQITCEFKPASYVREIKMLLSQSPYYGLRAIECEGDDGQVILRGTVANFYLKQLAQAVAVSVAGRGRVRNQLGVALDF